MKTNDESISVVVEDVHPDGVVVSLGEEAPEDHSLEALDSRGGGLAHQTVLELEGVTQEVAALVVEVHCVLPFTADLQQKRSVDNFFPKRSGSSSS